MEEIIFVKVFKISVFNILLKKLFKIGSEECKLQGETQTRQCGENF